ncbi:MAG TPA: fructosamine kinase family protein [Polyangiaceae bacterium]|jgi:fructosamine-3-kinase|nr:fructosamine kinase family protein [Polyangiaceae bacterium]
MAARLALSLEQRLGQRVARVSRLSGGDINDAFQIELEDGARWFVKSSPSAPPELFPAEARGLELLRRPGTLRVPTVRAVSDAQDPIGFLVLELLEPGRPSADFDERLGRGLAGLHRSHAPVFGLDHDNFIGSLPQTNAPCPTWAEFFRTRRLEPQLERAVNSGQASYAMRRGFARLFERLSELVGPDEPPCLLHGDLWSGNVHVTESGEPCLLDPAVYGGHREVDLAMMRLFGGFAERVFAAYGEAFPLSPGASERVALYQLYPLMVHVNLFGGGYGASVERALARYV